MARRALAAGVLCLLTAGCTFAQNPQVPADQTSTLKVGDMAPDFELPDHNGNMIKLSDFRGKQSVVLAFFVLAFTGG